MAAKMKFNPNDLPKRSGIPIVSDVDDWLLIFYRFLQLLGDMHRFVLYREDLNLSTNSPWDQQRELLWISEYGPDDLLRLEIAVYNLIQAAFKAFPAEGRIFLQFQVGHTLCASKICVALLDKIPLDSPLIRLKFLSRDIFHMYHPKCRNATNYAEHIEKTNLS